MLSLKAFFVAILIVTECFFGAFAQASYSTSVTSRIICSTQRLHWPTQSALRGKSTSTQHITQYITVTVTQHPTITQTITPQPETYIQTSTILSTTTYSSGIATVTTIATSFETTVTDLSYFVITSTQTVTSAFGTVYYGDASVKPRADLAERGAPSGQPLLLNASFATGTGLPRYGWNARGWLSSDFHQGSVGCVDRTTTYLITTSTIFAPATTTTVLYPAQILTSTVLQTSTTTIGAASTTTAISTTYFTILYVHTTSTYTTPTVVTVPAPYKTTQSSICAPTNLISQGPEGYPVRLLLYGNCTSGQGPCSGVPGTQITDISYVVDPSDCCQICIATPGCAGSWSQNNGIGITCELINTGCGTSAFWYLDSACTGDVVETWVQRGCGSITYGGNFCPAPV